MADSGEELNMGNYWELIASRQGETFYTKSGLPFSYQVEGNDLYTDRRERPINRRTFERAMERLRDRPGEITGPKSLSVYGAPYVWAILCQIGGGAPSRG